MRLRRKPWIEEAIKEYEGYVSCDVKPMAGQWRSFFGRTAPLHVELGTGKGRFISQLAASYPENLYLGIEVQLGVLYYAARKAAEGQLRNLHLLLCDISRLEELVAPGEVDCFYLNFSDPWPKSRHAKRRLTHGRFLEKYARLLAPSGKICLKTDNRALFNFSVDELRQAGWELSDLTYDLHASAQADDNILTEYEIKFSSHSPICRLVAYPPQPISKGLSCD